MDIYREGEAVPRVSVIIPTYNRAHYLGAAIDSVLGQTSTDIEVIVVDDGSTDQTRAVLEQYGSRVRPLYQEHCGVIGAVRNHGLRAARGQYVAFLDSDDLWLPTLLETQVAALEQHPEWGMVYCDGTFLDDATGQDRGSTHVLAPTESGWIGPALLQWCFVQTPGVVLHAAVLEDVGLFSEAPQLNLVEDWELWLRIAARYQIGYIDQALYRVRRHTTNVSHADPGTMYRIYLTMIEHVCAHAPEVYEPYKRRAVFNTYYQAIKLLIEQGRREEARDLFTHVLHAEPMEAQRIFRDVLSIKGRQVTQ